MLSPQSVRSVINVSPCSVEFACSRPGQNPSVSVAALLQWFTVYSALISASENSEQVYIYTVYIYTLQTHYCNLCGVCVTTGNDRECLGMCRCAVYQSLIPSLSEEHICCCTYKASKHIKLWRLLPSLPWKLNSKTQCCSLSWLYHGSCCFFPRSLLCFIRNWTCYKKVLVLVYHSPQSAV